MKDSIGISYDGVNARPWRGGRSCSARANSYGVLISCEMECRRNQRCQAVLWADWYYGLEKLPMPEIAPLTGRKIAIVGSGATGCDHYVASSAMGQKAAFLVVGCSAMESLNCAWPRPSSTMKLISWRGRWEECRSNAMSARGKDV